MITDTKRWFLLTGGNGFLGSGFIESLDEETRKRCVCLVRKPSAEFTASVGAVVEGFFGDEATLHKLDGYQLTAVVHLAAVTGGCSEADAMAVNVEGTRVLMRYLIDRGCRRFVLASSIALVGLQRTDFRPLTLPITEEHPCLDRDGYGLSKFLMEEIARYHQRQNDRISVFCLRFGVIRPDDAKDEPFAPSYPPPAWTYAHFTKVFRRDAVRALRLALDKPEEGCFLAVNIVARQADLGVPVEQLVACWNPGWAADLSAYEGPDHERDAIFSTRLAQRELGFSAEWTPLPQIPG